MASRKLTDLHPKLQPIAEDFLAACAMVDIDVLVTCTYRSNSEQHTLYAQGRTTPGHIVTNAKEGQSAHNFMLNGVPAAKAFDIVPMRAGKCIWDSHDPVWDRLGNIGRHLGLNWAGDWTSFKEYPHFQLKD